MTKKEKQEIMRILEDHQANCGDSRGRDGEYLSDAAFRVLDLVNAIKEVEEK